MNTKNVIFGIILTVAGCAVLSPVSVRAAESASFILNDAMPAYAERGPAASEHYLLNEDGLTWVALPVASTHFQIVSGPPVVSSSSSSSSVSVSSASSASSNQQGGGGRRGEEGEQHPSAPPEPGGTSSMSSTQSMSSQGMSSSAPVELSPPPDYFPQAPSLHPRADHGTTTAASQSSSSQRSERIAEQEVPNPLSLDAYFYGDNCQLTDSPVKNAASPAREVVCVYRLYLVQLPDISLLGTWGGAEMILHLMDILLILLGVLLIGIGTFLKWRQSERRRPSHKKRRSPPARRT